MQQRQVLGDQLEGAAMRERMIDIKTTDGEMNTHIFQPDGRVLGRLFAIADVRTTVRRLLDSKKLRCN
jgi:hypothetical protein